MPTKPLSKKDVWIIIPGYNEEKYIEQVLKKVKEFSSNIIFVDDGCTDKTVQLAKKQVDHVLSHSINLGKGAALKTGCEYAFNELGAEAVIFLDSDDQHDASEIPKFIDEFQKGNQVVFGVRTFSQASMPFLRFLGNKLSSAGVVLLFGSYVPDILSGYKGLTKKAYRQVRWKSAGYEVEMEIAVRVAKQKLPFSIIEIDTIYHDTNKGVNLLDALQVFKRLLQWRISL